MGTASSEKLQFSEKVWCSSYCGAVHLEDRCLLSNFDLPEDSILLSVFFTVHLSIGNLSGQTTAESLCITMAHVLFFPYRSRYHWISKDPVPWKIALSIFLIVEVFVGLQALVWVLHVLYRRYKSGGRVSSFMIMLLFCDLLALLLNPYIVTKLYQDENCWEESTACRILSSLWSGSLFCALHLQPVVALEGALSVRHSSCSAHFFFPSCSIVISIIGFAFFFFCEFYEVTFLTLLGLPLSLALTAISCIVTRRAPPNININPYRTLKPSCFVLAFVSFTVILHLILVIVCADIKSMYWRLWVMCFILMSLRVITDPLLCVLVYRKDLWVQCPPTPAEPDDNIELVHIQSSDTPNAHTAQNETKRFILLLHSQSIIMYGPGYRDDSNGAGITATFFIVVSMVASLLPFLWCLRALYVNHKSGGRKPIFVIVLLSNVLLQCSFSAAAIRFYLNSGCSEACERVNRLFNMAQLSGIFLHQLVALESVLSLRNPLYTTDLFSMPCSISLSVALQSRENVLYFISSTAYESIGQNSPDF
ncbi:hypothetical protein AMEX_G27717 [Astyanax mexicanus]|uniref:G-protein coupled receptors family 1 profile domain-containing protein n=1 Tax=Astyanax mexicanus TaxID=7994 RepID=A0A8T2KQB7_ASTMX|nr:hypothetical protein AMEX_G27717 [Astyanax mexicanus]